jgi:uncharacterized membrane protein YciS (DUF1049 family)
MMAWALCAVVLGADFAQSIQRVDHIVAEQNYDRSVLLTLLATRGLQSAEGAEVGA